MIIDPNVTWAKVEARLATEADPVLRRNLETLLEHMKAEAAGDVDGLLKTLSDDVAYHSHGSPDPAMSPAGPAGGDGFAGIAQRKLRPEDIGEAALVR